MIIDTILYAGEEDMLECRLTQIGDVIDYCIVIEGTYTFTGEPRIVYNRLHQGRFEPWADKILHHMIGPFREEPVAIWSYHHRDAIDLVKSDIVRDPWVQERYARDCGVQHARDIMRHLERPESDAMVLIADVDEIPRTDALQPSRQPQTMQMRHHCFNLNWLHPDNPSPTTVYAPLDQITDPGKMRLNRFFYPPILSAGWHLSWFGTDEERRNKAMSFSHVEEQWLGNPGVLAEMERTGKIWHDMELTHMPNTFDVPAYVKPEWRKA